MYYCNHCKEQFEIPFQDKEWIGDPIQGGYQTFDKCPICGDDDFEEMHKCQLCNTYILSSENYCKAHKESISEWMLDAYERIQVTTSKNKFEILEAMAQWIEKQ